MLTLEKPTRSSVTLFVVLYDMTFLKININLFNYNMQQPMFIIFTKLFNKLNHFGLYVLLINS